MSNAEELEVMYRFSDMFNGGLWYDCTRNGELTYSIKNKEDVTKERFFDASFLDVKEAIALMEKSVKDGVNYLFEKVKDHEYTFEYNPDVLY